jgi:hypothetical protein
MRTYGRLPPDVNGYKAWVIVETDANGNDDLVWLTTLIQCLKLSPNESPFFANYGVPAQQSVITQIFPDFYVSLTQSQFSQYFASLLVARVISSTGAPIYNISVVTHLGVSLIAKVPV